MGCGRYLALALGLRADGKTNEAAVLSRRRSSRALPVLVTAGLVMTLAVFVPAAAGAARTRTRTQVRIFQLWKSDGELASGHHVAATEKGSCWAESIAIEGEYRCMVGNLIYDPCFVKPRSASRVVGCVGTPWEAGAEVIDLTKKLPHIGTPPKNPATAPVAWSLALSSGQHCVLGQGTLASINGQVMPYFCKVGVAGEIDKAKEPWTTEYSKSASKGPLEPEVIWTAWY